MHIHLVECLAHLRDKVHVGKDNHNKFGGFHYRSLENIIDAIKPHLSFLDFRNVSMTISSEMIYNQFGVYMVGIVRLVHAESKGYIEARGYAREEVSRSKFDVSQLSGAASTYAKKYALCDLLLLSSSKDPDHHAPDDKDSYKVDSINLTTEIASGARENLDESRGYVGEWVNDYEIKKGVFSGKKVSELTDSELITFVDAYKKLGRRSDAINAALRQRGVEL